MKISIIGAGNVGATLAMRIAEKSLADVVMVDIKENIAKAKALDLSDAAYIASHNSQFLGTKDFKEIKDSAIVVITAGFPRSPGMAREELLSKNKDIVEEAAGNVKKYAKEAVIIVVTNPLDIMSYVAYKKSGFSKNKVFGMAGSLDVSRFVELIAQKLNVKRSAINTIVMGSHGDTMVPVISHTKVSGRLISQRLSEKDLKDLIGHTKKRGAEIVSLLGQGSAYFAPSAAVLKIIEAILKDKKEIHCVSAFLEGEYGFKDIYIGVPVKLGKNGIEEILEIELSPEEKNALQASANKIKENLELI